MRSKKGRPKGSKNKKPPKAISAKVKMPITLVEFEQIVDSIANKQSLTDTDQIRAIVANRIMHLPIDQITVDADYFENCVLKSVAYVVARNVNTQMTHRLQIDQLDAALKASPTDQQARDHLFKAAEEGSEYAKLVYDNHFKGKEEEKVIPFQGLTSVITDPTIGFDDIAE